MQGAPEKRATPRTVMYASKRFEEQRRRWDFVVNLSLSPARGERLSCTGQSLSEADNWRIATRK